MLLYKAYERRFPTCPLIPVFIGCDVILDEESEDGATRTTERRCKLNVDAPYLLKKVLNKLLIAIDFDHSVYYKLTVSRSLVLILYSLFKGTY